MPSKNTVENECTCQVYSHHIGLGGTEVVRNPQCPSHGESRINMIVLEFGGPVPPSLLRRVVHTLNNFYASDYESVTGYRAFGDGFGRIVHADSEVSEARFMPGRVPHGDCPFCKKKDVDLPFNAAPDDAHAYWLCQDCSEWVKERLAEAETNRQQEDQHARS